MKIEVLKTFLHGRDRFQMEEVRQVSDSDGEYFCSLGFARDMAGQVDTAEPSADPVELEITGMHHDNDMETAG